MKEEKNNSFESWDNLLIHVGFHKTGTTWLQKHLFASHSDVFTPLNHNKNRLSKKFVTGDDGYVLSPFDYNEEAIRDELQSYIFEDQMDPTKVKVISHERLSGHPHGAALDSKVIAERLKRTFPKAKILIVIREQKFF